QDEWSESTISKMSSSLPKYASDFGLLKGKAVKQIAPYFLPDEGATAPAPAPAWR
ncbi:BrxA family protein, partial [Salmonella enterica subsp. enterica serovar Enteritidis]|uniref:BrxA family protein n=1 Tax=Salmonella enterica TaxID=28901 RepID=UPI0039E86AE7